MYTFNKMWGVTTPEEAEQKINEQKNAVGIVGVFVIISICIAPIIKLTILAVFYHLAAALCQPIADDKIVKLLDEIGETFKVLLAIMCSISVMQEKTERVLFLLFCYISWECLPNTLLMT